MKVLVTGASGFIGKNLIQTFSADKRVVATYWHSDGFPAFVEKHAKGNVEARRIDLLSDDAIASLAQEHPRFDACIYLAANGDPAQSVARPAFDLCANTLALVKLLERIEIGHLIYFSSGAVYDGLLGPVSPGTPVHPHLPYAISKLASEQYLEHFQRAGKIDRYAAVRFFGAYGPFEPERKIYTRLVRRFALEKDPRFTLHGDGTNLIDAMYVGETMRAISVLLDKNEGNLVVDLCSGAPLTLRELVEQAAKIFGLNAEIAYEGSVPEFIEFRSVDRTMKDHFGFEPNVALEQGLNELLGSLRH